MNKIINPLFLKRISLKGFMQVISILDGYPVGTLQPSLIKEMRKIGSYYNNLYRAEKALVESGFVTKTEGKDRESNYWEITNAGREFLDQLYELQDLMNLEEEPVITKVKDIPIITFIPEIDLIPPVPIIPIKKYHRPTLDPPFIPRGINAPYEAPKKEVEEIDEEDAPIAVE